MTQLDFPATERNREPILQILRRYLPKSGLVLEVASGSGQHSAHFAPLLSELDWQPSDIDPRHLASIDAWGEQVNTPNLRRALHVDAALPEQWPIQHADVVYNANMIHIAPWECCVGLMRGASMILPAGALLFMYGPYARGAQTEESNRAFDRSLRGRDSSWGLRELEAVINLAGEHGLEHVDTVAMPANNLSVIYRKGSK